MKNADIGNDFLPIEFANVSDRETSIYLLMEDLQNRNFFVYPVHHTNDCWFFYIYTNSEKLALISKSLYPNEKAAQLAAANLSYIGTFKENYHGYIKPGLTQSSFNIELNLAGYAVYLQQIVEDKQLYLERRQAFLDHLLARFAESFTDFALLSFDSFQEQELKQQEINKKSKFLSAYDKLGRDRGKAYDYKKNGWNNNNISGYEQRVQLYAGIDNCAGQSLCHFEVMEYTGQFYWTVPLAGKIFSEVILYLIQWMKR